MPKYCRSRSAQVPSPGGGQLRAARSTKLIARLRYAVPWAVDADFPTAANHDIYSIEGSCRVA